MTAICAAGYCQWCGCTFRKPSDMLYHRCAAMQEQEETMAQETQRRTADDILEAEAGCEYYKALLAVEAQATAERAYEDFQYDEWMPKDYLDALKLVATFEVRL